MRRTATSLKETEEESGRVDAVVVGGGGHARGGQTPCEDEEGHQRSSGDSDDDVGRERLPSKLSNGVDRTGHPAVGVSATLRNAYERDSRVLLAREAEVL